MRKGDIEGHIMAATLASAIADAGYPQWISTTSMRMAVRCPTMTSATQTASRNRLGTLLLYRISSIKSMIGQPVSAAAL